MMWKRLIVAAAALIMSGEIRAQGPPLLGVWELDTSSSKIPAQIKSETRSYVQRSDGYVVVLVLRIMGNGTLDFIQVASRSDGKDYPQYTSGQLADLQINGATSDVTYSEKVTGDNTAEVITRQNGRVVNRGTRRISSDGKSMTVDVVTILPDGKEMPILLVYRKRQ